MTKRFKSFPLDSTRLKYRVSDVSHTSWFSEDGHKLIETRVEDCIESLTFDEVSIKSFDKHTKVNS